MIELIIFIVVSYSVTDIFVNETIFGWLRKRLPEKPFSCMSCLSVWIGFLLGLFFDILINMYISPFIYAMISYFSVKVLKFLNKNNIYIDDE